MSQAMAPGCQLDFYLLGSAALDPARLACRLALKAWEQGHSVVVLTENPATASALDELMWEYPEGRFLPHARLDGAATAPVSISCTAPDGPLDLVINLTPHALSGAAGHQRVLEIVPFRNSERAASRDKYRAYRAQGLEARTHEINQA